MIAHSLDFERRVDGRLMSRCSTPCSGIGPSGSLASAVYYVLGTLCRRQPQLQGDATHYQET
jgi:hypothetical protein